MEKNRFNQTAVIVALGLLVAFVFGNAVFNSFVWDDGYLIVQNPYIKNPQFIQNLFVGDLLNATTEAHRDSGYYRPLSMLSFMADYGVWGLDPKGFHLTNIVIHFLNSVLIFYILFAILGRWELGFLASVLFAVHPLHVEAVTPVFNRMGIQSAFFVLSSLYCFMRSGNFTEKKALAASLVLFFLGLLSKEDAVVVPLILFAYDYYYFSGQNYKKLLAKEKLFFYLLCFLTFGIYFALRKANLSPQLGMLATGQAYPALAENFILHLWTVFGIFRDYCVKTVLFWPLTPQYWVEPVKGLLSAGALAGAGVLLGMLVFLFRFRRTYIHAGFFTVFFLVTLLPFTNIIPIGESYTFRERFLYLPSLAVCFAVSVFLIRAFEHWKYRFLAKVLIQTGLVAVIFCLGALTVYANYVWRTDYSLWRHAVSKSPQSRQAQLNLGVVYLDGGNYERAAFHLSQSLSADSPEPLSADTVYLARLGLAKIFTDQGDFARAKAEIEGALRVAEEAGLNPFAAYDKLGLMHASAGNRQEAKKAFETALSFNKNFVTSLYNLGVLYYELTEYARAEATLMRACLLNPDLEYAPYALGLVYAASGRVQEAQAMAGRALKINPDFQPARVFIQSFKKEYTQ